MKCTIIYATESGTSQEVAEKLSRDLLKCQIKPQVIDIKDYDRLKLPLETLVLFVLSTAGHGEVPDSMKPFWSFLLIKNLPPNSLANTKFGVLGLGDSSYVTYNFAAKKLYQRLLSLGAKPLLRRGDADDQHDLGLDYEVEKWTGELVVALSNLQQPPLNISRYMVSDNILPKPKFILTTTSKTTHNLDQNHYCYQIPKHLSVGTLTVNQRISAEDWEQDVRHLEIEIPNSVKYIPGDVAYIFPKNPEKSVHEILQLLNLDPDLIITHLEPSDYDLNQKPQLIQLPISLFDLFSSYLDIMGSPRRYFFELLSYFTDNELEKERLQHFASREGGSDLRTYNQNEKRNYIDVLGDFPDSIKKITLNYLFDLIPPLKPRPFSISSSVNLHPHMIHITAGIHSFQAPLRRLTRLGLCSQWFTTLKPGTPVPFYIKESGARLPKSSETPMIMVGPGTGCAIFRSFIQEKSLQFQNGSALGDLIFYFGCRHEAKDFLYREEMESYRDSGVLKSLRVAFSRDQSDGKKLYVQSLIREDSRIIWNLIDKQKAYFYISGSSGKMPKDVKHALLLIIKENLQLQNNSEISYENAEKYFIDNLELPKRFVMETW
ncbi:NADPH-dependent diflavin oxidoreductase 1 [Tieghemostelium lacteum]|uniref:NADPH-dependent diflavin oxidoreductase 1 n=1 Tax=Tieghemostelium lacteum TaxID=361077 RepID=A0A151ZKW5_TIELA|nr:NADPH-dependent diflavin oxidoreductase 1 [Tieghemostelium lacteum]|eukprot:KYQ94424.1 NADPH-dependent diflavin oxidoreductase 1 [Tieghemostelium lacteum]